MRKTLASKQWTEIVDSEYSTPEHPEQAKVTIKAEIVYYEGESQPYFSVTHEAYYRHKDKLGRWGRWREGSFGQGYEVYAKHFPEIAPYWHWHLCGVDAPMHYVANGLYWLGFGQYNGHQKDAWRGNPAQTPQQIFREHVRYGVLPEDANFDPDVMHVDPINGEIYSYDEAKEWLQDRLPALVEAFKADMRKLFGDDVQLEKPQMEVM
jgi:hypothetical protein